MQNGQQSTSPSIRLWSPQPGPQKALIDCPLSEIFFGGARGGGKTDGLLGKWAIKEKRYGSDFNAIMFRRTTVSSEDAIDRSKQIYGPLGGKFNETKLIWRMPNGGRVAFAYLDSIQDAQEYQGRNVTDVWIEEAGQYPESTPIDRLFGVLRSAAGVPVQMVLTANPGGPGQLWLRERYQLHPFPQQPRIVTRLLDNGVIHKAAVIPSRLADNRILAVNDPEYINRLYMVGSPELVKAWLEGDWSAVEGAFFSEWSESRHVVPQFDVPADWTKFRSMDWGFAKPFSVGWWAIVGDEFKGIPRGALVRYREWYGCVPGKPNTGLRLTAKEVAQGIKEREQGGEKIAYGVLDPAAFSQDGGPSHAEAMMGEGVMFRRADNKRVAQAGAIGGWNEMRQRLRGEDGVPMLYVMDTCTDFIRTVPVLQHDLRRPEDLDTEAEDHIADEARYGCMSRPFVPIKKPVVEPKHMFVGQIGGGMRSTMSFNDIRDRNKKLREHG
jgi:hypothetical protein